MTAVPPTAEGHPCWDAGMRRVCRMWFVAALLVGGVYQPLPAAGQSLISRIAAARPGDTVLVRGGVWEGDLVLDQRIALIGVGMPVIRGSGNGSTITITADSCTVAGFVIERCGRMLVREDAGILAGTRACAEYAACGS